LDDVKLRIKWLRNAVFILLAKEIGVARRTLSSDAGTMDSSAQDSSNPLVIYVQNIINARLGITNH